MVGEELGAAMCGSPLEAEVSLEPALDKKLFWSRGCQSTCQRAEGQTVSGQVMGRKLLDEWCLLVVLR